MRSSRAAGASSGGCTSPAPPFESGGRPGGRDGGGRRRFFASGGAEQRSLHLAGALVRVEAKTGGKVRRRQAALLGDAGGDVASTKRGCDSVGRLSDDGKREHGCRPEREGAVVVEQRGGVEA